MKVKINRLPVSSIEDFAEKHDLTMVITERAERAPLTKGAPFVARFEGVEVKVGVVLESRYGEGPTPEAAVVDYTSAISNQTLVHDAYGDERRSFHCPKVFLADPNLYISETE